MIANEYSVGFRIALHLKDLGIALALARETGAALPVAALAAQLEAGREACGNGRSGRQTQEIACGARRPEWLTWAPRRRQRAGRRDGVA